MQVIYLNENGHIKVHIPRSVTDKHYIEILEKHFIIGILYNSERVGCSKISPLENWFCQTDQHYQIPLHFYRKSGISIEVTKDDMIKVPVKVYP